MCSLEAHAQKKCPGSNQGPRDKHLRNQKKTLSLYTAEALKGTRWESHDVLPQMIWLFSPEHVGMCVCAHVKVVSLHAHINQESFAVAAKMSVSRAWVAF